MIRITIPNKVLRQPKVARAAKTLIRAMGATHRHDYSDGDVCSVCDQLKPTATAKIKGGGK